MTVPVTTNDFICAQTDTYFHRYVETYNGFGKINHYRKLTLIMER